MTDVAHELSLEIGDGSEHAACDDVALDLAEPQLDLVEPRGVRGSEVQMNLRVRFEELFDRLTLVSREVIGDHVDLFAAGLIDHDVGQEGDKLRGRVPLGGLAKHLAGLGVEGHIQRQGTVTEVSKAMAFKSARRERQHRIFAIQSLNVRLFVHAENSSVRRRVQIKTDDISRLLLKVRIVRGHVALDAMGLQAVLAPNPRDHHVADAKALGQLARRPVRRVARCMARALQDPRFQLRREHRGHLAYMPAIESRDALLGESLAPAGHKAAATVDAFGGLVPRMAVGQQQYQPRSSGIFRPIRPAVGSPCQFHTLRIRQGDGVCHGHHYSLQMAVTVH